MIHLHTPLGKQFLHIPIRQAESQVPSHCTENNLWLKMSPLEDERTLAHDCLRLKPINHQNLCNTTFSPA